MEVGHKNYKLLKATRTCLQITKHNRGLQRTFGRHMKQCREQNKGRGWFCKKGLVGLDCRFLSLSEGYTGQRLQDLWGEGSAEARGASCHGRQGLMALGLLAIRRPRAPVEEGNREWRARGSRGCAHQVPGQVVVTGIGDGRRRSGGKEVMGVSEMDMSWLGEGFGGVYLVRRPLYVAIRLRRRALAEALDAGIVRAWVLMVWLRSKRGARVDAACLL